MKKRLSLLMVLMMVLSLVPMSVFATAGTMPGGAIKVDDTDEETYKQVTVKLTQAAGTTLVPGGKAKMTLNKGEFAQYTNITNTEFNGLTVVATTPATGAIVSALATQYNTLTKNAEFNYGAEDIFATGTTDEQFQELLTLDGAAKNVAYITIPNDARFATPLKKDMDILVTFWAYFDRAGSGDFTVSVNEVNDSGLDVSKAIVSGVVAEGTGEDMKVAVVDAAKRISFDGGELSTFTIKDINKAGNISKVQIELPDYVKWDITNANTNDRTKVSIAGAPVTLSTVTDKPHILEFTIANADLKKEVIVLPKVTVTKRDASKGDVKVKVMAFDGTSKKETVDATIGQIADYDVTMTAWEKGKKEIPAMYGGEDTTVKVKLAGVKGSFTNNRAIDFTIKGADIEFDSIKGAKNLTLDSTSVVNDGGNVEDGEFTLNVNGTDVDELEFEMKIKAKYAQNGAVTLEADSRDFGKMDAEIAKVTPAYTVETKVTSIKKGESLATADIIIKEAKAGILDTDQFLVLNLNDRSTGTMTFGADYKIEATNGLKTSDGLYDENGATKKDLSSLALEIKTSSSKEAGTITISNVMVKVDGATVDGDKTLDTYLVEKKAAVAGSTPTVEVKSKATAVEYALSKNADLDADYATPYVKVVKEYGTIATTTVFKIGSKEYTVNGAAMTANEAPFVAGKGYTMLPVRALGESLGLKADWNAATKTATFSNDSKVASVVIGADTMYVNGTPFKLSAKAVIKNGSTFVELRSLASAFGVELQWDAATKMVTIIG